MPKPDIFLSYNRSDSARARQFADALGAEGFTVWWDATLRSGETYDVVTETALRESRAVVVLWSASSVDSRWVRAEATEAERSRKLVPAMIEQCKRPIMFELTQTAELSHWKGDRNDIAWRAFVSDLRGFVGGERDEDGPLREAGQAPIAASTGPKWLTRRVVLIGSFALLAILLAIALFAWQAQDPVVARTALPIEIESFTAEGSADAAIMAQTFRNTIQEVLGEAGLQTRLVTSARGNAGLGLTGSVIEANGRLRLYVVIEDLQSGVAIWSEQFEGDRAEFDQLGVSAAVAAVESFNAVREVERQRDLAVPPDILARFIEGMSALANPQQFEEGRPRRIFEDIVARMPEASTGHALLALSLANEAYPAQGVARDSLIERARAAASEAIRIDPAASAGAYDALVRLSTIVAPNDFAAAEKVLLEGLEAGPDFQFLNMRECELLTNVGRIREALAYCQRAMALRPTAAPIAWRFAKTLAMDRQDGLAERAIERAAHYYPDSIQVMSIQFDILAFGDRPERAEALLPRMLDANAVLGEAAVAASRDFLRARATGSEADADKAAAAMLSIVRDGRINAGFVIKALALFGRIDDAFALFESPELLRVTAYPGTFVLFEEATASLRADPRFWPLAAKLGLVEYWTGQDQWPDFCGREIALAECKAAARAALGNP